MDSRIIGKKVVCSAFGLDEEKTTPKDIKHVLASTYCNPRGQGTDVKMLDYAMKNELTVCNREINK